MRSSPHRFIRYGSCSVAAVSCRVPGQAGAACRLVRSALRPDSCPCPLPPEEELPPAVTARNVLRRWADESRCYELAVCKATKSVKQFVNQFTLRVLNRGTLILDGLILGSQKCQRSAVSSASLSPCTTTTMRHLISTQSMVAIKHRFALTMVRYWKAPWVCAHSSWSRNGELFIKRNCWKIGRGLGQDNL